MTINKDTYDGEPSYVTLILGSFRLGVDGLPDEVWPNTSARILEGIDLGFIRVKDQYKADSKRNIMVTFSDEEMSFFYQMN